MGMRQDWEDATNVYRTKLYIVEQVLDVKDNLVENAELCSHDIYYRRTKQRDVEYEKLFGSRRQIDGKRLPATMCSRKYVN